MYFESTYGHEKLFRNRPTPILYKESVLIFFFKKRQWIFFIFVKRGLLDSIRFGIQTISQTSALYIFYTTNQIRIVQHELSVKIYAWEIILKNVENYPLFWTKTPKVSFNLFQISGFNNFKNICVEKNSTISVNVIKIKFGVGVIRK